MEQDVNQDSFTGKLQIILNPESYKEMAIKEKKVMNHWVETAAGRY